MITNSHSGDNAYTVDSHGRNGFAGGLSLCFPITGAAGIQQEFLYAMKGSRQDVTINSHRHFFDIGFYPVV